MKQTRLVFAFVLALLSGCSKEAPSPQSKSPLPQPPLVSTAEPGRHGGRLMLSTLGTPGTFNPLFASDPASVEVSQLLFSSLVRMDFAAQEIRPALAESWSVAPDQKTWTFNLRRGLRWSDGAPLTADDVLFTWNDVIYNPELQTPVAEMFQLMTAKPAVTKTGENSIRIVLPEIFAPFVEFFGTVPILPKHSMAQVAREKKFNAALTQIISSGPYRVKQMSRGATVLERNPEFWVVNSKNQRLPYFDEIVFVATSGFAEQSGLFLGGETMIHDRVRPDEFERFQKAAKKTGFRLLDLGTGAEKDFICFNQNTNTDRLTGKNFVAPAKLKWFRQPKFRQAISCAIDRERLAREVYSGRATPAYDFISRENKKWCNTNTVRFACDLNRARALLAEIGIQDRNKDGILEDADGNQIEFALVTNSENSGRMKTAALLREMFGKLGIKMGFQTVDFPTMIAKVNRGSDYDCALLGLGGGGNDPITSWSVLKSSAPVHQWFPNQAKPSTDWEARIDQLMDAQLVTLDFAARKKAFDEVQAILAGQQPMIFTVSPNSFAAVSLKIGNVRPSASSQNRVSWNLEELFFK